MGHGGFVTLTLAFIIGNPLLQAMMYGPLAAFVSEVFGARARYTGASLGYQIATTIGAGLVPLAATSIMAADPAGNPRWVSLMVVGCGVVGVVAIALTARLKVPAEPTVELPGQAGAPVVERAPGASFSR